MPTGPSCASAAIVDSNWAPGLRNSKFAPRGFPWYRGRSRPFTEGTKMFKKLAVLTVGVALTGALVVAASPATATTPTYCSDKSDIAVLGASSETGFGTTGYPAGGQTFSPTT